MEDRVNHTREFFFISFHRYIIVGDNYDYGWMDG